jgi:DNA-directed RNA polymerase specialized sigma24 family protein
MATKATTKRDIIADISNPKGYNLTENAGEKIPLTSIESFTSQFKTEEQKLFHLYYTSQKSLAEIALIFKCSEATIDHRVQRLLHFFRQEFNPLYRRALEKAKTAPLPKR